jgi:hypothetical protein
MFQLLKSLKLTFSVLIFFGGLVLSLFILSESFMVTGLDSESYYFWIFPLALFGILAAFCSFIVEAILYVEDKKNQSEPYGLVSRKTFKISLIISLFLILGSAIVFSISAYKDFQYKQGLKENYLGMSKEELWDNLQRKTDTAYQWVITEAIDYSGELEAFKKGISTNTVRGNDQNLIEFEQSERKKKNEYFYSAKQWNFWYDKKDDAKHGCMRYEFDFNEKDVVKNVNLIRLFGGDCHYVTVHKEGIL